MSPQAPPAGPEETPPAARTPRIIVFALLLFAFVVASPLLCWLQARHVSGESGWAALPVMLGWMAAGGAASIVGIVCTVIGAQRLPRSAATHAAISLAFIAAFGLFCLLVLGSF